MSKKNIHITQKPTSSKIEPPKTELRPLSLQKPNFRLECCNNKKYCLGRTTNKDQLVGFAKTIHQLSQLSWQQIEYGDKGGTGSEKLNFLRDKLPPNVPNDVDIIGIKYWGYRRLVGYKDSNNTFCIVWCDNGTLYDHN